MNIDATLEYLNFCSRNIEKYTKMFENEQKLEHKVYAIRMCKMFKNKQKKILNEMKGN